MLNQTQRREKEIAVYEAMLTLLGQGQDLSTLTVSRIAAAAGIGKGTVYEYFPSKNDILRGMAAYCTENEVSRLENMLASCRTLAAANDAMEGYLRGLTRMRLAAYQIVARVLVKTAGGPPAGEAAALLARLREMLWALYGRLRAAGELTAEVERDYFTQVVAAAWLPCLAAISPCDELQNRPDPDAMVARTRRMVERALR